ncbi:Aromatic prenyltransferase DMATS type [Penicillium malachiteum]|uniref:Aromatic prenyltransferase DMATS type n=1 Tax=Penicillium malachiteum TaxID=1324776 RepID=UPI0025494F21|nr:Aromatic prenyltransferase DMATS type [Penicillium malachiteum]KAJ5715315.1 Aromatic prenyltransferase DMATS type [Penicillium malachiteum]
MTLAVNHSPLPGKTKGTFGSMHTTSVLPSFAIKDAAEQIWWDKTAPLLSKVLESAEYSIQDQYLYMMLYRTVLLPRLGPHPHTWDSFITYSGIPVEFSINFQNHGPPTARIGWEPVSHESATDADPLNLTTINCAITTMSQLNLKGFDTKLLNHMIKALTSTTEEASAVGREQLYMLRMKNQVSFGLDLKGGEVSVKCYLYPSLKSHLTGQSFRKIVDSAVESLGSQVSYPALGTIHEYLEGAGMYNRYSFIGIDCTTMSKSRLKIYNTVQDVTWAKLRDVWTLGGRFESHATTQRGLEFVEKFWRLLTLEKDNMAVGIWNYELAPGSTDFPNPKYYFIMHGMSDMENAQAIVKLYEYLGWNEKAATFIDSVKGYFPTFESGVTSNLIQYVSLAYSEKTGVYLSVYFHSSL